MIKAKIQKIKIQIYSVSYNEPLVFKELMSKSFRELGSLTALVAFCSVPVTERVIASGKRLPERQPRLL